MFRTSKMNRYTFTRARISKLKNQIRQGESVELKSKTGEIFQIFLNHNKLFHDGKFIVAKENIPSYLKTQIDNGAPISIEQLFWFVQENVWGVSRRAIKSWLQSQETYQMLKTRPSFNHKINQIVIGLIHLRF